MNMKHKIVHYRAGSNKLTKYDWLIKAQRETGVNTYFIIKILNGEISEKDGNYFRYQTEQDKKPSLFLSVKKRMTKIRREKLLEPIQPIVPKIIELKEPKYIQEEKLENERIAKYKIDLIQIQKDEKEAQIRNKIENDCDDYYKSFAF